MKKQNKLIVKLGLPVIMASIAFPAFSAPVSVSEAARIAADFHLAGVPYIKKARANGELKLAYTASSNAGDCFYVFNFPGGGFSIVSADDRLPSILGFSENGSFDASNVPVNVEWWLGEYRSQIEGYLEANPQAGKYVNRARPNDKAVIEPLLTTRWNQGAPYNNDCPYDSWGRGTSVTGCVATAMAQVMKYHNWPENPEGVRNSYRFTGTTLHWDRMIDDYETQEYTTPQAEAVALLMHQCGVSVDMQYSAYESGAYSSNVPVALRTYFKYNPGIEMHFREYYTFTDWNNMVYEEISTNGPVYYSGRSDRGGHAFVCDGYGGNNYFHFNWGWGGYQDGYFLLNALNPATGGTGSYAGGYNSSQSIMTKVYPTRGDEPIQKVCLATGGFAYDRGKFVVTDDPDGYNMFYNPLAPPLTATFGIKIVPFDGGEARYVAAGSQESISFGYGFESITVTMPTNLSDGKYKITPVMRPTGDDWMDVLVPLTRQTYVTLEVSGGKLNFINEGPSEASRPHLLGAFPQFISRSYSNTGTAMRATITNVGDGDFMGMISLMAVDHDNDFGNTFSVDKWVSVPSHFSTEIEFDSDHFLSPATYDIYIFDEDGNDLVTDMQFDVYPSDFVGPDTSEVNIEDVEPRFYTQSEDGVGMAMHVLNPTNSDVTLDLTVEVLDASTLQPIRTMNASGMKVEKKTATYANFASIPLDVEPGEYYWRISDTQTGRLLSPVVPLIVESEIRSENGIYFVETSSQRQEARLVAPPTADYEGRIDVPATIAGLKLVDYDPDVFTFADQLNYISLPSTFKRIFGGAFYFADALRSIRIRSAEPPMVDPGAFAPGMAEKIAVYLPAGTANLYAATAGWADFPISNWKIEPQAGVTITDGLEIDPLTSAIYSPYYVSADEELSFDCSVSGKPNILAEWTLSDGTTGRRTFEGRVTLPAIVALSGTVRLSPTDESGIEELEDSDVAVADLYSVDGRLLGRDVPASRLRQLPAGIYIHGKRKITIR